MAKSGMGSRLDEILAGLETGPSNPADGEDFERPSNFPEKVEIQKVISKSKEVLSEDLGDDFEHTRSVLRHLMDKGLVTLEGAINVAKETENARAIEVVSQMMNTISDVTTKLMKLHEMSQIKNTQPATGQQAGATTNNIYVLDKSKSAKSILNDLLDNALNTSREVQGERIIEGDSGS